MSVSTMYWSHLWWTSNVETAKNKHGQWQGNSFYYKMQRLKKSVVSWATNQSQLSMEEGCISWPIFLKWLGSVEKAIFLSRDIALLRRKLQKERSSESDEWPRHSRGRVHSARGQGAVQKGKWIPNAAKSLFQSQSQYSVGKETTFFFFFQIYLN